MKYTFGEALLAARKRKNISQQQLADSLPVSRSSVANWEADRRLPDATIIAKIAKVLNVELTELLDTANNENTPPVVIIVDDNKIILTGCMPVIKKAIPNAIVVGFTRPSQAIKFAKENHINLAFLDIELGSASGIELCNVLLDINSLTNVVFLTAYPEYSIEAWDTKASGFMVKPITIQGIQSQLKKLRHPFPTGGVNL